MAEKSWNCAGKGKLLMRPWRDSDPLGTQGLDLEKNEAWAVVNRGGSYAVGNQGTLKNFIQHKKQTPSYKKEKRRAFDLLGREWKEKIF